MSWKDILKGEIEHFDELPKGMPDAVREEVYAGTGDGKQQLSLIKSMLDNPNAPNFVPSGETLKDYKGNEINNKTHKIISYNDDDGQMFYRIVEK
tara:strand:+ start:4792 stop:5076 length:285 start_codon:yes stop_codon:yes gene_type:complete